MGLILKEHTDHVAETGVIKLSVVYLESSLGRVQVEICDDCEFLLIRCEHEKNSWNEKKTQLTCDLCGVDGT